MLLKMSLNSTFSDAWTGYVGQFQEQLSSVPPTQLALLVLVNLPIISIVLNALYQLVGVLYLRCFLITVLTTAV